MMMENIRLAANNVIVKIIFGIIILAFIFTGVGGFLGLGSNANDEIMYIAKVDGKGLGRAEFEREYQMTIREAGSLAQDEAFTQYVRGSILSNQINNLLLYQFAGSLKTTVSNDQIKNYILQQPAFFQDGRFNNQRYLEVLSENNYTPDMYAEAIRSSMQVAQVVQGLINTDFVLPVDSDISRLQNQKREFYLVDYSINNIDPTRFAVSDDDVAEYYNTHKQALYHNDRLKIKYVANLAPSIAQSVTVTDSDIKDYYDKGGKVAVVPAQYLYSVASFDNEADADEAYKILNDKTSQEQISFDSIGWIVMDDETPDLLVKADLKKQQDISKPIAEDGVYYIVKLDNVQAGQKRPFNDVKEVIKDTIYAERVQAIFNQQQKVLDDAAGLPTIEAIAKQSGLPLHETDWTYENENTTIGRFPEINDIAFSDLMLAGDRPTGAVSDVIHVANDDSTYIIQVSDFEAAGIPEFDQVKADLKSMLITEKKKQVLAQEIDSMLAKLQAGETVDNAAFVNKYTLARNANDPKVDQKTLATVFSLVPVGDNKLTYGVSQTSDDTAQFVALVNIQAPEYATDLTESLEPIQLSNDQYYFMKELREKANIEIMPNINM